ncbi:MAG: YceD family protein [Gammaproteobacteria bacterium]|nr:YceD family protein [Gammaproteobacteria bacterium]
MSPSWKALHGQLPESIDPIQLAERGAQLTGTLPLKSMPRISQGSLEGSGQVNVDLFFERPEGEKIYLMHGVLRAQLRVTCQRCLEPMDLSLEASPWVILVRSGEQPGQPEGDADILVVDKPISLSALVEDELLLALPMVPMHEPDRCPAGEYVARVRRTGDEEKNPFAVLSRMKKSR